MRRTLTILTLSSLTMTASAMGAGCSDDKTPAVTSDGGSSGSSGGGGGGAAKFPTDGAKFACLDEHKEDAQTYCTQNDTKADDAEAKCRKSNIGTGTPFDGACPDKDSKGRAPIGYCSGGLLYPAGTPKIVVVYPPYTAAEATTFCAAFPGAKFIAI